MSDADGRMSEIMTKRELLEVFEEQTRPIDFEELTARGVLKKSGPSYLLLKPKDLPKYAWRQVGSLEQTSLNGKVVRTRLRFRKLSKSFGKLGARLRFDAEK